MVAIIICTILALLLLLYRVFVQNFYIKRSILYIPALIYLAFVLISYAFSSVKDVAWMGWNDRFEGTLILICYIFMALYIMNLVNSEKGVKLIIYPLAITSFILSLIGLSQAFGRDFFQSTIGQKLIVPNMKMDGGTTAWEAIDKAAEQGEQFLKFTFQNNEIYQTVYNINYVSFYLTLLIPIFGLLFIHEKANLIKKTMWGILFGLLIFNLIGSASSGGLLGMFVVVIIAAVIFNKKLITWWKPIVILLAITLLVGGITFDRWSDELTGAVKGVVGTASEKQGPGTPEKSESDSVQGASGHEFEYFANKGDTIEFSLDGNVATIDLSQWNSIAASDNKDNQLNIVPTSTDSSPGKLTIDDNRFSAVTMEYTEDEDGNQLFDIGLTGEERTWSFTETESGIELLNDLGNTVKLENIPHWGFDDNPGFGSGRGYIWSRSLPMIKDTVLIGHGADTYCIYFPHKDYIGKYNAGWNVNMVVDKPHNMYIGIAVNTGLISLLALLTFFGIYVIQSFRIYRRNEMNSFLACAGAGIFLGICGFLVSGFVDDSTVSVMPMFYGLLGTGIAINMLIKNRD
jgi:O-antigen ligase